MRLAIRGKLFFGFAVVISLGLSALWIAVHSSNRLLRDALSIVERELPGVALIINADRDAYQSNLGISFALEEVLDAVEANRTLEPAVIEEAVATISDNRDQVRQRFDQFVELFPGGMGDPVFADAVATFKDHYDAWSRITDRLIVDIRASDASSHGMYHHGAYSDAFGPMRESMDILTERGGTLAVGGRGRNARLASLGRGSDSPVRGTDRGSVAAVTRDHAPALQPPRRAA